MLNTADHSTISRLKLVNEGNGLSGHSTIGIYSACVGCQLLDLEVLLNNPSNRNYGVYSVGSGVRVSGVDVVVDAAGSYQNIGVFENGSNGEYYRLDVNVVGGVSSCALVADIGSNSTVRDSSLGIAATAGEALRLQIGSSARLANTRVDGVVVSPGGNHCFHVFESGGVPVSC